MAGTIVADTIQDGAGNSTAMDNAIYGSAKAWVNFNGNSGGGIRASYNVSSISRTGTGAYTVNFTNALIDGNYSVTCGSYAGNPCSLYGTPSTTSFQLISFYAGSNYDVTYVTVAVFR
jgi:hypothetical protein